MHTLTAPYILFPFLTFLFSLFIMGFLHSLWLCCFNIHNLDLSAWGSGENRILITLQPDYQLLLLTCLVQDLYIDDIHNMRARVWIYAFGLLKKCQHYLVPHEKRKRMQAVNKMVFTAPRFWSGRMVSVMVQDSAIF